MYAWIDRMAMIALAPWCCYRAVTRSRRSYHDAWVARTLHRDPSPSSLRPLRCSVHLDQVSWRCPHRRRGSGQWSGRSV